MLKAGTVLAALVAALYVAYGPAIYRVALVASSGALDTTVGVAPALPADAAARVGFFSGKRALVVGGTRGIGRGIATVLAANDVSVTVVGRNESGGRGSVVRGLSAARAAAHRASVGAPWASPDSPRYPTHRFFAADLSTRAACDALAARLKGGYDYVFFTVGAWPDFGDPRTADGQERVVALDVVARHAVLKGMADRGFLGARTRVMATLASTLHFPLVTAETVARRLRGPPPTNLASSLVPVAVAGDAFVAGAPARLPGAAYVGIHPGAVATDVFAATFPRWLLAAWKAALAPIALSELEAGEAHVAVLASDNVLRRPASFFNHFREARDPHPLAADAAVQAEVWDFLETKGVAADAA